MPPRQPDRAPGAAAPHGSHPGRGIQPAAGAGQGGAATGRQASGPLGERGPGPPGRELLAHHQPAPGPSGLRPAPHDGFAAFPGTGRRPAHRARSRPGPPGCWPRRWTTPFWPRPSWPTGGPGRPHLPPGGGLPVPPGPGAVSRGLFRPPVARLTRFPPGRPPPHPFSGGLPAPGFIGDGGTRPGPRRPEFF